jgi:CheY-like chemotaxis protein
MAHLLSFTDTRPQFPSPKVALLVEHDPSLLNILRATLKNEGYVVKTAAISGEGLRLYRQCGPFNVVLIDYYVPPYPEFVSDCLVPQTHGTALASDILKIDSSQRIIIAAFDYRNAGDVKLDGELKHIPLLLDTSNSQLRRALEIIEVNRAIEALTSSELLRLQQFANFRVRGLGRAARGRTGEDLLRHAMLQTLIGAGSTREGRHWNKHVDFAWHLNRSMRSISDSWKRQFKDKENKTYVMKEPHLMSELVERDADGQEQSRLYDVESGHFASGGLWKIDAAADERLIEKEEEARILAMVKDDPQATQVLQGLLDGLKKIEIMSKYCLSEKQYVAAVKRILKLLGRNNV